MPPQSKPFTPPLLKSMSQPMSPVRKDMPAQKSGMGKIVSIFVAGLVVGFLIGWGWSASRPAPTTTTNTTETTSAGSETADTGSSAGSGIGISNTGTVTASATGAPSFTVPSPQDSGMQVAVASASVSQPTWIVVYDNVNSQPGRVLGAELFFSTTKSGAVDLLRGTLPGQKYFVGESVDDGDKIFSIQNDKPVRDAQGNPVWVTFQTR